MTNRRPIAARDSRWASKLARHLAQSSVTPNQISVVSVGVAALGAGALLFTKSPLGLIGCAVAVQLRLLCNLLDGMVAVEGGKKSTLGALYNEFPDRVADSMLLVALGYAVSTPWVGWLGALAAALTAYVRVFGGALGQAQDFRGPMAKQHRMAMLTGACVLGAMEQHLFGSRWLLLFSAMCIALGSLLTCWTRTRAIAERMVKSPC